jgi:hypothetical protein
MRVLDVIWPLNQVLDDRFLDSELNKEYFLRPLPEDQKMYFIGTGDSVRYGAIGLAIKRICTENIEGSLAEVGKKLLTLEDVRVVYRMSKRLPNKSVESCSFFS